MFTIVVGLDFSPMSDEAARVAVNLAKASGDAIVYLFHVVVPPVATGDVPVVVPLAGMETEARQKLAETCARIAAAAGDVRIEPRLHIGSPRQSVPDFAREVHADLIVVGTHGRTGLARLAFGSVAESVTRHAPCSVLTVRPREISAEETIEPACPRCEARAKATAGAELLCEEHAKKHVHGHRYRETPDSFGLGSMMIRPE